MTDSRYHRQRERDLAHPNRKVDKPYHDTSRPYRDVAAQIENALNEFKEDRMLAGRPVDSGKHDYERSDDCTNFAHAQKRDGCHHSFYAEPHCAVCGDAQDSPLHTERSR